MAVDISQIVNLIQNSKNTLFIVGNTLPIEYQLFLEYLHGLRVEAQKPSSIFVNPDVAEAKRVFTNKNVTVLDDIHESKFIITIPTNGGALGSVSYDTTPEAFKLFISPGSAKLQTSDISFNSVGEVYDLCLSFGVPSHIVVEKLQKITQGKEIKTDLILFGTKEPEEVSWFKVSHVGVEVSHYVKMILGVSRNAKTTKTTRSLFVKFSQLMANYLVTDANLMADLYKTTSDFLRQGIEGDKSLNVAFPVISEESTRRQVENVKSNIEETEYIQDEIEDSSEELSESNLVTEKVATEPEAVKTEAPQTVDITVSESEQPKTNARDISQPLNFAEIAKRIKSTRSL